MCLDVCLCKCDLEDRSKHPQVFEQLPSGFLLLRLRFEGGRRGLKECTDVLRKSALFELNPQRRNPNPNTWASDYRLMLHLDLWSQSTKDRVKPSALYSRKKSHILNPTVFSLIPSHVRQPFTTDSYGDFLSVWRSFAQCNTGAGMYNKKNLKKTHTKHRKSAGNLLLHQQVDK